MALETGEPGAQAECDKLKAREREEAKRNEENLRAAEARANAEKHGLVPQKRGRANGKAMPEHRALPGPSNCNPAPSHKPTVRRNKTPKRNIDTRGGRLWAEANEPWGAVFQFTLPNTDSVSVEERAGGLAAALDSISVT
jgi:hypothetical protein